MNEAALARVNDAAVAISLNSKHVDEPILIVPEGAGQIVTGGSFTFGPWVAPHEMREGEFYQWREIDGKTDGRIWVNDAQSWGSFPLEVRVATVIL